MEAHPNIEVLLQWKSLLLYVQDVEYKNVLMDIQSCHINIHNQVSLLKDYKTLEVETVFLDERKHWKGLRMLRKVLSLVIVLVIVL